MRVDVSFYVCLEKKIFSPIDFNLMCHLFNPFDLLLPLPRYWNQLDEDLRIMLERFDAETADEVEHKNQSDATTSFLAQVSSWDNTEMEER